MKLSKSWIIFGLILILAAFVRLYKLDQVPPSLDWDEAAVGWNAYSIWTAHLDEYGTRWPWVFKSFGDYKAPAYIYITAPFVGILGLNPFVIRLPSALAGIATVMILYFLAKEIGNRLKLSAPQNEVFALVTMFLLALSPWHLLFSRPAFEPTMALFFITSGIWLAFVSLKRPYLWFFSGVFFILSLYTYHSPKLFLPFFLLAFILIFFKEFITGIWKYKWISLIALVILTYSLRPLLETNLQGKGAERLGTSILLDNNHRLVPFSFDLANKLEGNFIAHLIPSFYLAQNSPNPRLSLHNYGLMPTIEWIFLIIGLIILFFRWKQPAAKLLLAWFIFGIIPAAIGKEVPHSLRSLNMVTAVCLIASLAVVNCLLFLERKHLEGQLRFPSFKFLTISSLFILLSLCLFSVDISRYFSEYYHQYPVYAARDWQYGYQQAATYVLSHEGEVDKIIFTNSYGQAYVFTYLFQKRRPLYVLWGEMSKYVFRDIKWDGDKFEKNVLVVGTDSEIPAVIPSDRGNIVKEIPFPDGSIAFRIVKTSL